VGVLRDCGWMVICARMTTLDMLFAECPRRIIPTISDGVLVSERLSCLRSSGPPVPKGSHQPVNEA